MSIYLDIEDNNLQEPINTQTITVDNENEVLNDDAGNFTSLASEIETAGNTLNLTKDYTYNNETDSEYIDGIVINKAITIDGKGHAISGNNLARILYVNASDVILKNIVFTEGYINDTEGDGGAIYWNGDYGNVDNCTFISNIVENVRGGAIYWNGTIGIINDSKFTYNYAKTGGAIFWKGTYGFIDNCTFISNNAMAAGGAIYWMSNSGSIKYSKFENNNANSSAGAIFYENVACNLVNTTFNNNSGLFGGAIIIQNNIGSITNCTFTNNGLKNEYYNESQWGGAIYCLGLFYTTTVTNTYFENNAAQSGSSIYSMGSINSYNSTYNDAENSQAAYIMMSASLINNTFNNNNYIEAGTVSSSTRIILSNVTGYVNKKVNLTGYIVDDNNNKIKISGIHITLNETSLTTDYNNEIFYATYTPIKDDIGNLTISATDYSKLTKTTITKGTLTTDKATPIIEIIVDNVTYPNNITITVKSDIDGNYNYKLDTIDETITISNGNANITIPKLTPKNYTIYISIDENENHTKAAASKNFTIYKETPIIQIEVKNTTYPNDITITVKSSVDGNYTYHVGDINNNIIIINGTANITLSKLAIGDYAIEVNFKENENYTSASVNESFKIISPIQENTNVNMYYLDGSSYKVRIYDADSNVAGAGVSVTFKINGKTYTRTTDSNGYATLNLNINTLVPKTYKITATYNGYTVSNNVKVKQIIKAKKTTKIKKSAKKLKIKITLKGKSVYKKKTLKVKFKGKTYKVKTNKKGIAYFKLTKKVIKKLKVGKKYKYTITYSKNTLKRFIKVKK